MTPDSLSGPSSNDPLAGTSPGARLALAMFAAGAAEKAKAEDDDTVFHLWLGYVDLWKTGNVETLALWLSENTDTVASAAGAHLLQWRDRESTHGEPVAAAVLNGTACLLAQMISDRRALHLEAERVLARVAGPPPQGPASLEE